MSQNEESKVSTGQSVIAEVADALKNSAGEVRGRLVKALTERELAKRVELLDKALVKRAQLSGELNKIRPKKAFTLVDGKMQEVPAVYTEEESKQFNKQVKEAREKLEKFDAVLEAAFANADKESFAKLTNLVGGKSEEPASE